MEKYIKRNVEDVVLSLAKAFPVIMITGPRQVGKSTLLHFIASGKERNIKRVTFDNIRDRELAISDPQLFLETYGYPVIIDEFQYAPNLLFYIKIKVDEDRIRRLESKERNDAMYYLTGSQRFLTMEKVSESLAGRVGIIDLYGLSDREIQNKPPKLFIPEIEILRKEAVNNQEVSLIQTYNRIFKGSFPETYKNKDIPLNSYFQSYVKTYIEKDIRKIINITDEIKFMKFMVSVAARSGQELNLNEIANDAEISNPTANVWLSILVNTGLVVLLEPYTKNIIKRVVKRPKIYFMDTGLACYLTKYPSAEILEASPYAGHIFETYVISEVIKSFSNNGLDPKRHLHYYRDNKQNEIDLIIDYNDKLYLIEIKKSKNPSKESIKSFKVLDETKQKIALGVVLCMVNSIFPLDKNNYCVPISYI